MKVEVGLLNVLTVLNLCLNVGNPGWVGMVDPACGVQIMPFNESSFRRPCKT